MKLHFIVIIFIIKLIIKTDVSTVPKDTAFTKLRHLDIMLI